MRLLRSAAVLVLLATPVAAQDEIPANLVEIELQRTRTCTDALSRLEALDNQLSPLAARAQRLLAIAGAINIEESAIVDSLNVNDPLEAAVRDWFRADAAAAQRYISSQSQEVLNQRTAARRAIQETVAGALEAVQAQADSVMAPTGTLRAQAQTCSNVILVRGTAVEACSGVQSRVCTAARDSTVQSPFRFTDGAESLWYRQELRPWTTPAPLQLSAQGTLSGARTIGSTRVGNVAINVSLNPLLRPRTEVTAEDLAIMDTINATLGIRSTHPEVTFVPALAVQANLPRPLGGEEGYVLHFGPPEEPNVVWAGQAGTGAPFAATIALAPDHVAGLAEGFPLTFTAIREVDADAPEVVFSIELTSVNQVQPVRRLLAYMGQQLSGDLLRLIPLDSTSVAPQGGAAAVPPDSTSVVAPAPNGGAGN